MNDELKKKIALRNILFWGAAIIAPSLAMVIVDATTRETPNQNYIAILTSAMMMALLVISNGFLTKALASLPSDGVESSSSNG